MGTSLLSIGTLGWVAWCGARNPDSLGGTNATEKSLLIFNCHKKVWDQPIFAYLSLLPVFMWYFLYILSYIPSVQLDFRWFLMVVVLYFNCNFDVGVKGSAHHVYLHCHLDCNPIKIPFKLKSSMLKVTRRREL